jgi:hypothetical protein
MLIRADEEDRGARRRSAWPGLGPSTERCGSSSPPSDTDSNPHALAKLLLTAVKQIGHTYVRLVLRSTSLPESRLHSLYEAEGFGGEKTMRARVLRELIDEIRILRHEIDEATKRHPASRPPGDIWDLR